MIRPASNWLLQQVLAGQAPNLQRLTAPQYHQMLQAGIIHEGASLELIDGLLVHKDRSDLGEPPMSHGRKHASGIRRLQELADRLKGLNCCLQTQLPIAVSESHEPEPDGAVLRGSLDDYDQRLPKADEVLAVIEVADSSLEYDRSTKQRIYATAGIPVYWILNLRGGTVEAYESPSRDLEEYQLRRDYRHGDTVRLTVDVDQFLDLAVSDLTR